MKRRSFCSSLHSHIILRCTKIGHLELLCLSCFHNALGSLTASRVPAKRVLQDCWQPFQTLPLCHLLRAECTNYLVRSWLLGM